MIRGGLLLPLFLFAGSLTIGQENLFPLESDPGNGREVIKTRIFEGSGLWGYIDGGADIYMEYGFERVYVQDILLDGHPFTAEAYWMEDSRAAFGIFSVNRYRCTLNDSLAIPHCISPYQVLAVLGKYYLVLSDQEGSEAFAQIATKQLQSLQHRYLSDSIPLPEFFTGQEVRNRVKYLEGPLGILNGYPALSGLFEPFQAFSLFLLPLEGQHGPSVLARVDFKDPVSQNVLGKNLVQWEEEGEHKMMLQKRLDPFSLLFMMGNKADSVMLLPDLRHFEWD
ncbi:MAG TPA: hypothetical protein PKI34_02670 [Bacteroidales bacterium]|nr:hypothetical protein [Bacteroidales bacterium]